jgi:signal transduction histidine kinase
MEIFKAQESERGRISQELHDDTIQTLLVIANRARVLAGDKICGNPDLVKTEAERIRDGILQVSDDIHRLSLDLRPSILDNSGLVSAIFWLVDRMNESQTSIYIKLDIQGEEKKLRPDAEVTIFRIIQEALNNARRHANANNVWIIMKYTSDTLTITIRDDGKGFRIPKSTDDLTHIGKLGITGIQERVKSLDGKVYFRSKIGKGTLVTVKISI